jgi:membrane-associated phospholipid phosphatase
LTVQPPGGTAALSQDFPAQRITWRTGELVGVAYFVYAAVLTSLHFRTSPRTVLAWTIPALLWGLAQLESRNSRPWSRVVRDWLPMGFILPGYWLMNWFGSPRPVPWQQTWLGWDRQLLDTWKLRSAVEAFGWPIPALLESAYLCLYALPAVAMAAIFLCGRRDRADQFLTTLFLGVFTTYALLPHFPSQSPRNAFPGMDLPHYAGIVRAANVWLLDHLDITSSVFPSGHVSVAFSVAFGSLRALPRHRRLSLGFFAVATAVYIATIYGRYHYAVDGLTSIGIAFFAWWASPTVEGFVA